MQQQLTNIFVKLGASIINAGVSIGVAFLLRPFEIYWQVTAIILFFLFNILFLFPDDRREIGMLVIGSYWVTQYPLRKHFIYAILYTLSFATLFVWIWFPFDLFLINMFLLQLPFVLKTGTTFHGYISGKMETVLK